MMSTFEGMIAPKFSLKNEQGKMVSLDDFAGKQYIVLFFYPKDSTPTCTTEACDFRDSQEKLTDLNTVILGVSADNEKAHTKFIEKYGLPFSLLVDDTHEVSEAYGVWQLKKTFGKEYMGIVRSTFLIDPTGTIVKEWRKVKVKGHVEEVLETLQSLVNNGEEK